MSGPGKNFRVGRHSEPVSTQVPYWATLMPGLGDAAYRLYVVLLSHVHQPDGVFPSTPVLSRSLGKEPSEILALIDELERMQLITIERDSGWEPGPNIYLVHETPPAEWTGPSSVNARQVRQKDVRESSPKPPQQITASTPEEEDIAVTDWAPDVELNDTWPDREHLEKTVSELCGHLADLVKANGAKRPKITYAWREAARGLLLSDEYTVDQVWQGIRWAQEDTFWASRTITMTRLRKHFDQIIIQARKVTQDTSTPQGRQNQQTSTRRRMDRLSEFMTSFEDQYGRPMSDDEQRQVMTRLKKEIQ